MLVKELNNHANGLPNGHTVRSAKHASRPACIHKTIDYSRTGTVPKSIAFVKLTCGYVAAGR
jgi:hypothetical protein